MKELFSIIDKFKDKKIFVIGDLMLDKYIFGKVERVSPEAPVPIVTVEKENYVPGGAANAASNVSSLGGKAYLAGIVGDDVAKDILIDSAKERFIDTQSVVVDLNKPTIQKIRVLGQNQQLLRIDYEKKEYIDPNLASQIILNLEKENDIDVILISDYCKGTITKRLMESIKEHAKKNKIILIVDPKPKHKSFYKDVSVITPNKREAEEISGVTINSVEDLEKAGRKIMEDYNCNVLITTGEKGMSVFEKGKEAVHIPTVAKEVFDVSGAGDTVIATLSLALSSGASLHEASILSNHAAGIKVGKLGTACVYIDELRKEIS